MNKKVLILIAIALFIRCSIFAQQEKLPVNVTHSFVPVYDVDAGSKLNPICVGISITSQ